MQKNSWNQKVFLPPAAISPSCCIAHASSKVLFICLHSLQSSWGEWRSVGVYWLSAEPLNRDTSWNSWKHSNLTEFFVAKSAFLEKQNETVFPWNIVRTQKQYFLGWGGWSAPTLFGFISVRKWSYWQNWHVFVKLLNSVPWLECEINDGAKENFALCWAFASSGNFMCSGPKKFC